MAYSDDLIKLRKAMMAAFDLGVVDSSGKEIYEATLIQIMNEAERNRQTCLSRAEDFRKQAAIMDGQVHAFTQVSSIVYNVLMGYVQAAEKQKREEVEFAAEAAEKQARIDAALALEAAKHTEDSKSESSEEHDDSKKRKRK